MSVALAGVAMMCAAADATASVRVGIADQNPGIFAQPAFTNLGKVPVRITVPWDAAIRRTSMWNSVISGWNTHALPCTLPANSCSIQAGPPVDQREILVVFNKSKRSHYRAPSVKSYVYAFRQFRKRWPMLNTFVPWNEPNHKTQPLRGRPRLAAGYYNALTKECRAKCRVIAGGLVDSARNQRTWLPRYRAALRSRPSVWAYHNYSDVARSSYNSTKEFLRISRAREVWLTETGGVVKRGGWPRNSPTRQMMMQQRLFRELARPWARRITRAYIYQWQASAHDTWDSGLVAPGGAPRPAYFDLLKRLSPPAPAAA